MPRIRTSKEGKLMSSSLTGNTYLVHKWEDLGNGKVRAISKKQVN